MKRLVSLLLLGAVALRADVEFSGFFSVARETYFSLSDPTTRRSSGWLKLGDTFGDSTLVAFDRERESLTLKQGDRVRVIPLRIAKVKDGHSVIRGTLRLSGETIADVQASLFPGEESVFPVKPGLTFRLQADPLPDGTVRYRSKFVATGADGREEVLAAPSVIARAGKPFAIQVGDYGFSFTP